MTAALFYIPPALAAAYLRCPLDEADRRRLAAHPQLAGRLSWQTSRLGKHLARRLFPQAELCLSHSRGHSLIAAGARKAGVDLEPRRPRDYLALAEKVCSDEEITQLRQAAADARPALFYRLWTLKEALIKAHDLRFPTDMPAIGLSWPQGQAQIRLARRENACTWLSAAFGQDWQFSALWFSPLNRIEIYSPAPLLLNGLHSSHDIDIMQAPLPEIAPEGRLE